jgi:3-polyprenyl-4-hydroxybenzoate decarboxylase
MPTSAAPAPGVEYRSGMRFYSLDAFVSAAEGIGEVVRISGADCQLEIGALTELLFEQHGPLLLFEHLTGATPEFRSCCSVLF